ncbi:MAG: DUF349 domain-containing protein [Prevotellaceae bacterium]|jgi:hypothetical protein|nr:DUF349 domain-containing protein [Prevotellaceae bacterium]
MSKLENTENTIPQVETNVNLMAENSAENAVIASLSDEKQEPETVEETVIENSAPEVVEEISVAGEETENQKIDEKSDDLSAENEKVSTVKNYFSLSREELVEEMRELLVEPAFENIRATAETIKQAFYKKQKPNNQQVDDAENAVAEKIEQVVDAIEGEFKELLTKYRELKASANAKIEEQKVKNLERKQAILAKLEELTSSTDDLNVTISAFHKLQNEWKKIEQVPQSMVTDIWKAYNRYQEQFYDLMKIHNQLRDYDFKKNLEAKTVLCVTAEKLESEQDAVMAFQQLQKLHEEWREIGPVAREIREEIWTRFKEASAKINKKHQSYFESLKETETENLRLKSEICETIESVDLEKLKTFKQWDSKSKEIAELQEQWKAIGAVPRKVNGKIFKRYRNASDTFFRAKSAFLKETKEQFSQNLEKRKSLAAQAEELKSSTDWKVTGDKLAELQKEWKKVGTISRKYSDAIWEKFSAACDYFFEQRKANSSGKRNEEVENLKLKYEILEKIKGFTPSGNRDEDITAMKEFMAEFNKVGFVPFKDKSKLQSTFVEITDQKFDEIRGRKGGAKTEKSSRGGGNSQYTELKKQLRTYENNIEFLSSTSKKGNLLLEQMSKKVAELKAQLAKLEN